MIDHIVLFQIKESASPEQKDLMMSGLRALKEKLPEIQALSVGENFSARSQGYTHGLVVRFRTREDLATYQAHPDHQAVVQKMVKPICDNVLAVDYEADPA